MYISIITSIILAIVAYISWLQYQTNKRQQWVNEERFKLDLFKKRFKVFDATRNVILQIIDSSDIDKQKINEFRMNASDAGFLFNDKISEYLEEMFKKAVMLNSVVSESKAVRPGGRLEKLYKKQDEITKWFDSQSKEEVKKLFSPYLQFEVWKESEHYSQNWISDLKDFVQDFIKSKKG